MPHSEHALLLGPSAACLGEWLRDQGDRTTHFEGPIDREFLVARGISFLISYGYRHILSQEVLEYLPSSAINLHISLLPWNRGADPNLWSFLESTPKGVSIHYLDEGLDTGDIIAQECAEFSSGTITLESSYADLKRQVEALFKSHWPEIRARTCGRTRQGGVGSFHRARDRQLVEHLLLRGWKTPVASLEGKFLRMGDHERR